MTWGACACGRGGGGLVCVQLVFAPVTQKVSTLGEGDGDDNNIDDEIVTRSLRSILMCSSTDGYSVTRLN
jgi:hypothetical protein